VNLDLSLQTVRFTQIQCDRENKVVQVAKKSVVEHCLAPNARRVLRQEIRRASTASLCETTLMELSEEQSSCEFLN